MNIELRTEQRLAMSPKMIQSTEILQMTAQDLSDYLNEAALENPVIDLTSPSIATPPQEDHFSALKFRNQQSSVYYTPEDFSDGEEGSDDWKYKDAKEENLAEYLWAQLLTAGLSESDLEILHYMLYNLDERGYLEESIENLRQHFSCEEEKIIDLLTILQGLDPAGVGARNLSECLRLQAERNNLASPLLISLVDFHLDSIAKNQLPKLCSSLGCTMEELTLCIQTIQGLNPKPGMLYCDRHQLSYLTPDVTVVKFEDRYDILLNESRYPEIYINDYYSHLACNTDDPQVLEYLSGKLRQAEWLRTCVAQRSQTLLSITKAIVSFQTDFFTNGKHHLKSLRLAQVAEVAGVHESTVSRGVRGKYLQCMWGIYPLNYFFPKGIFKQEDDQDKETSLDVKQALQVLVNEENKKKPYSDRVLGELLARKGFSISRRTVAKYRNLLGIGDTTGRRQY